MHSVNAVEVDLANQATLSVRKMLADAGENVPITFMDACLAIEVALLHLESLGTFCLDFSLTFTAKAVEFTVMSASTTRPSLFDLSDLRKILFMVCMPKASPDGSCVLLVQRVVFEHMKDPTVQYKVRNETTPHRD